MTPPSAPVQGTSDAAAALESSLISGLQQLGIECTDQARHQLLTLLDLLQQWNRTYNLTAIREPAAMITGHLLDSLSVLAHLPLPPASLLDLGCGAGFPGLPIAICQPDRSVTLLDSNQKKTRFVQHAIAQLGLHNCQVVHQRAEQFTPPKRFDTVICRAYTALPEFVQQAAPLVKPDGTLMAMKGLLPDAEMAALPTSWRVAACDLLAVPGVEGARHIIVLNQADPATETGPQP